MSDSKTIEFETFETIPDPGSAVERLRLHNQWRRGEIDLGIGGWHTPKAIGEDIDTVLQLARERAETAEARVLNSACPHTIRKDGVDYCALAESTVEAERKRGDALGEWAEREQKRAEEAEADAHSEKALATEYINCAARAEEWVAELENTLPDHKLSEVFAVDVAGWKHHVACPKRNTRWWSDEKGSVIDPYSDPDSGYSFATSADAVMPYLQTCYRWSACGNKSTTTVQVWNGDGPEANATVQDISFARAACLALIRAKRAERGGQS